MGINDVRPESAHNVVTEIERAGGKGAKAFVADVSNSAAVKKMFADFIAAYGTIDILINNAGIGRIRENDDVAAGTPDLSDDDWHKMLSTHLDSTFFCTREALKTMIPKKSGRIINLASIAATTGLAFAPHYCAAKGGIASFTKSRRARGRRARHPGQCDRARLHRDADDRADRGAAEEQVIAMTPIGRFGEPREIAAAALFLASDDGSFMVGQIVSPNGGYVI